MRKVKMTVELTVELNDDTVSLDDLCVDFDVDCITVTTLDGEGPPFGVGVVTDYQTTNAIIHQE